MAKLTYSDLSFLAFRYALGRSSYIVSDVVNHLIDEWDEIASTEKDIIFKEIEDAIDSDMAGMSQDVKDWERILALKGDMYMIARFLKKRRQEVKLSKKTFSEKSGVDLDVIVKLENGNPDVLLQDLMQCLRMFGATLKVEIN